MMIKLIREPDGQNEFIVSKITIEIPDDIALFGQYVGEVPTLLDEIESFIRAIGYEFKGHLIIDEGEES
jgi:hypothetical protein